MDSGMQLFLIIHALSGVSQSGQKGCLRSGNSRLSASRWHPSFDSEMHIYVQGHIFCLGEVTFLIKNEEEKNQNPQMKQENLAS